MFKAYILGKDRLWRSKLVASRSEGLFRKGSFEYEIHPDCVYFRRLLGVKLIRCIDYIEGCRNPLKYSAINVYTSTQEIPLDEIAMVIGRALKQILIVISVILSGLSFATIVMVAMKVFGMLEGTT